MKENKSFKFVIKGDPTAWKRPGQSRWGRYDTQKGLKNALGLIFKSGMNKHPILLGPIHLAVIFFMPIPKSMSIRKQRDTRGWHTYKPDLDNLIKLVLDSMNGVVFKDDSQICQIIAMKGYGETARTELTVTENLADEEVEECPNCRDAGNESEDSGYA